MESKSILPSNEVSAASKHFGRAAARKAATVNEVIIQDRLLFKFSRSWRLLLVAPSRDPQARLSEPRVCPRSLALSAVLCSLLCLTLLCALLCSPPTLLVTRPQGLPLPPLYCSLLLQRRCCRCPWKYLVEAAEGRLSTHTLQGSGEQQ